MNEVLQYPAEFLQETVHEPSACMVLPFEPQLHDKNNITGHLKALLAKVEGRLLQLYSTRKALPVLTRLQQLIASINFTNYKKSIALLASPYAAQLFYLDFPVTETVRTGEFMDIRDIVRAKCNNAEYLVFVFGNHAARMYRGTATSLTCVKVNHEADELSTGYDPLFLHKMDQGLALMLKAYGLPVFILGQAQALDQFKQVTSQADEIMSWIPGQFDMANEAAILMSLQPELHRWHILKDRLLLQKLHKAQEERKLSFGIRAVWNTATHHRSQLLVVEENFISPAREETEHNGAYHFAQPATIPHFTKDLVDDIIEKVLKDGGDVELVAQGTLSDFQQIALIEFHQSQ